MEKIKEVKKENTLKQEIAIKVSDLVSSCYGVVGLVDVSKVKPSLRLLKKEKYYEGVEVELVSNDKFIINVHLVLAYGLKISEISKEIYKRLNYSLKKQYGSKFKSINVYIEDLEIL